MTEFTAIDFLHLLDRVTYKPGYSFSVWPTYGGGKQLVISAMVEDSLRLQEGKQELTMAFGLPIFGFDGERHALYFIYHSILEFERHETDEWFELNGVKIYDPHNSDGRRGQRRTSLPVTRLEAASV